MASSTPDNPPNSWAVLNDYAKTVITLSSGLLVITVTFSNQLLKDHSNPALGALLAGVWVSLIFSILAGLLAAAFTINYLKHGRRGKLAILMANSAFFLLVLAGAFLVWFGVKQLSYSNKEMDIPEAVELAQQSLDATIGQPGLEWIVTSLIFDKVNNTYTLELQEQDLGMLYSLVINKTNRTVDQVELITPSR